MQYSSLVRKITPNPQEMHCNVPPGFGPTANGVSKRTVSPGSMSLLATRNL